MTEKRFSFEKNTGLQNDEVFVMIDNNTDEVFSLENELEANSLVTRVNSLADENEQLKSRVTYLERKLDRERQSYQKQHEKWEKGILEENMKLKQSNELISDFRDFITRDMEKTKEQNKELKQKLDDILELTELTGMIHLRKEDIKCIIKR